MNGPAGRAVLFKLAARQSEAKTRGNYPATRRILEAVRIGSSRVCAQVMRRRRSPLAS